MIENTGGVFKNQKERKLKKFDIIVIRVNNSGDLVNSRPCSLCLEMMKALGINKVYYSNDSGHIICELVKNMISIHSSKVMMRFDIYSKSTQNYSKLDKDCVSVNEIEYYDELIKKLPENIKEVNFLYFINYDLKDIANNYTIINKNKIVTILNIHNKIIKIINLF